MALTSVVLPTPLSPTKPIRSPRSTNAEKSLIIGSWSPKATLRFSISKTNLPERLASCVAMLTLPCCERRALDSSRKSFSARTRPSLRTRRALMPWRIQTSSSANFLSNSAFCFSSASICMAFNSR